MAYPYSKAGVATVAWGDITGTLADQTDLQAALDAKQDATGNADYTDDTYWENGYPWGSPDQDMTWTGTQWEPVTYSAASTQNRYLTAIGSWKTGFKPTNVTIVTNSGADSGNGGFLAGTNFIKLFDTEGAEVATLNFTYTDWNEDQEETVACTWDALGTADVQHLQISSQLRGEGPIIKSITFGD